MDERVLRAMAQWPNVPDVYGWVSLTARGRWLLRGEPITNPNLIGFINRNYERHGRGYAFQNGPQRVWVTLDYLPWVLRRTPDGGWQRHTGTAVPAFDSAHLDDHGRLILVDDGEPGLVHDDELPELLFEFVDRDGRSLDDVDLERRLQQLVAGRDAGLYLRAGTARLPVTPLRTEEAPRRFDFEPAPRADR